MKNVDVVSTEDSVVEIQQRRYLSIISLVLVVASTAVILIAPSIPSAAVAISVVITIGVAAILFKIRSWRRIDVKALNKSAYSAFSNWGLYGDPLDCL
jgi:hypothetical protein